MQSTAPLAWSTTVSFALFPTFFMHFNGFLMQSTRFLIPSLMPLTGFFTNLTPFLMAFLTKPNALRRGLGECLGWVFNKRRVTRRVMGVALAVALLAVEALAVGSKSRTKRYERKRGSETTIVRRDDSRGWRWTCNGIVCCVVAVKTEEGAWERVT